MATGRAETAGEDLELGDEAGEAGSPSEAKAATPVTAAKAGRLGGQSGVGGRSRRCAAVVQHPGEEEQRAGEQAVADHLGHGSGDGEGAGLLGARRGGGRADRPARCSPCG